MTDACGTASVLVSNNAQHLTPSTFFDQCAAFAQLTAEASGKMLALFERFGGQPDKRTVADPLRSARQYRSPAVPSTPPLPGQP
ncbi:hypothetical protein NIE79_001807 [Micromonospora sp. NIE79]|uniref:Uncharacterized protein n=1 Tax=Micromonospora trifolii TaxID=2911208 RepID=A0ABS9N209_9ACTN|nr:hypothetical protein [Micromonospora trifolii]MCG5443665.1 hypothetical protein [Micromonospora trifolii]